MGCVRHAIHIIRPVRHGMVIITSCLPSTRDILVLYQKYSVPRLNPGRLEQLLIDMIMRAYWRVVWSDMVVMCVSSG
jgi:hypothetical protein